MSDAHKDFYARRIAHVLHYIGAHLDDELSVERLSEVAGFSKFHFHRQFSAFTGLSVGKAVARMRLKRASLQLALRPETPITHVAFDAGFENAESFSRAFKNATQQSPSEFRAAPAWELWSEIFRQPFNTHKDTMTPTFVDFPGARVAVLEHRGPPALLMQSVQKFITWRKSSAASPVKTSQTFGVAYDHPERTAPEAFRFDICGSLETALPSNDFDVIEKLIPAGRCAVVRHLGSTDTLGKTVAALYSEWLPQSGEALRDFPVFFHYIKRMPVVSEHEQETDVYLPLVG